MKKKTGKRKGALKELVKSAREDSQRALELTREGNHHVLGDEEIAELNRRAKQKTFRFD